MVYWEDTDAASWQWIAVRDEYLPSGETLMDRCVAYCMSYTGCIGMMALINDYDSSDYCDDYYYYYSDYYDEDYCEENAYSYYEEYCYITQGRRPISPYNPLPPFLRTYEGGYQSRSVAFMQTYYESNRQYFRDHPYWNRDYRQPDGTISGSVEISGLCDTTNTEFGTVNYRNLDAISFSNRDDKNVIRDSDSSNCAAKCFETAGCSSFFVDDNGCTYIIGRYSQRVDDATVTDAGMLNSICPTDAFTSRYTRRSQFYCLLFAPDEAENIADRILQRNAGNADTPLGVWSFETRSSNPLIKSSQYVLLTQPDMRGDDERYRPVLFSIETHVRIGESQSDRKRKSADRESETIFVGEIPDENPKEFLKRARNKAKQASKQRSIMPRTKDILAEIEAIEQSVASFILDGGLEMPDNVGVAATGPIELIEFVQSAADGSVSGDCSSGSCECSTGFIDNGNGCEAMTVEQAATTTTTTTSSTITSTTSTSTTESSDKEVIGFLESLINKLESVFEVQRPGKPRPHLTKKWQALKTKFVERYTKMATDKGCSFAESYEDNSIDFDSVNTCRVRFS